MNSQVIVLMDLVWSAVAAVGFAVLFKVPKRFLIHCAAVGAVGHALRTLLVLNGLNFIVASLMGATVVGFAGFWMSRRYKIPSPVITVPAIIPLVPGSIAFQSLLTLISALNAGPEGSQDLFLAAAYDGVSAGLIIFGLGLGISAPFLLLRRRKPVV
jgi:uncharacterized membrane protein YjjB (DUF3815 family)